MIKLKRHSHSYSQHRIDVNISKTTSPPGRVGITAMQHYLRLLAVAAAVVCIAACEARFIGRVGASGNEKTTIGDLMPSVLRNLADAEENEFPKFHGSPGAPDYEDLYASQDADFEDWDASLNAVVEDWDAPLENDVEDWDASQDADVEDSEVSDDITSPVNTDLLSSSSGPLFPLNVTDANIAQQVQSEAVPANPIISTDMEPPVEQAPLSKARRSRSQLPIEPRLFQLSSTFPSFPTLSASSAKASSAPGPDGKCAILGQTKDVLGNCMCPPGAKAVEQGLVKICQEISCTIVGQVQMFDSCICPAGQVVYDNKCVVDCLANERRHTDGGCSPICSVHEVLSGDNTCVCSGRFSRLTPTSACECDGSRGLTLGDGNKSCLCASPGMVFDVALRRCETV
jgi:hypothetical protein